MASDGDVRVSVAPTQSAGVPSPTTTTKKRASNNNPKGGSTKKRARLAGSTDGPLAAAGGGAKKKVPKKSASKSLSQAPPPPPASAKASSTAALPDSGEDDDTDAPATEGDSTSNGDTTAVRRPQRRRVSPTLVATPGQPPPPPPPPPTQAQPLYAGVLDIINSAHRQLNDEVFDTFVPLILSQHSDDDGVARERRDIVVFTPLRLQTVLSDYYRRRHTSYTSADTVFAKLGTTREAVAAASLLVAIIHGPMTEEHVANWRLYDQGRRRGGADSASASADATASSSADSRSPTSNYHWSVVVYSRKLNMAYHYDSNHPLNKDRCLEVLGVLQKMGVLPPNASEVATPAFFPSQKKFWECGYYVLTALVIMADNPHPDPLTENDIVTYHHFFNTIHHENGCLIKDRLRTMLLYSLV